MSADEKGATQSETANPPAYAAAGGSRTAEKQYEFKPQENRVIGELAAKMHFVGLFLLAVGVLLIVIGVYPLVHVVPIVIGTLFCVVGLWTQRSSVSFKGVVYTEGHDISHIIAALEDLRKLYSLQFWLLIIGLVLAGATILALSFELVPATFIG
jgi:hypothetical protein